MNVIPNLIWQHIPQFAAAPIATDGEGGTWAGLIFFISIALGISFLCSILEAVLLSTSVSYVELAVENGKPSGRIMQALKTDVERPISAILTLNTVAHTVGAAGAGAEAVGIFGNEFFGVISAVLTILILVFSEIIPKTLGATYWKQLNAFTAYTTRGLVILLFPAVWILEKTTQLLKSDTHQPTISRMELEAMARIGTSEGALQEAESRILTNLLHLRNFGVKDIMTPRTVVFALHQDMTVREVVEAHTTMPYSRIPIYGENLDSTTGFVLRHDILQSFAAGEYDLPMSHFKRELFVVPESISVAHALDEFITKQEHIILVIDEFGGTAGIVTMEDALETLLGIEITDESDVVEDLRKMAEQRYQRQQKLFKMATQTAPITPPDASEPSTSPSTGD